MATIKFEAKEMEALSYTPGDYIGLIDGIVPSKTKNGKRCYEMTLTGDGFGKFIHRIYDTVFGQGELYQIYTALGIDPTRKDVDDSEIVDNYIAFTIVEDGEYNDKPQYRSNNFRAVEDTDLGGSEENDEDDDW